MRTIIATDIHGITREMRSMLEIFGTDAIFLSPWQMDVCPFKDEQEAVCEFVAHNGIESYAEKIRLAANNEPAFIVAFSVGATAAWIYSASSESNPLSVATLFYGSRIRDYSSLVPRFGVTAIFAEQEPSFSPVELAKSIAGKDVLAAVEPHTAHGFMNPRSKNHVPSLCSAYLRELIRKRESHRSGLSAVLNRHSSDSHSVAQGCETEPRRAT